MKVKIYGAGSIGNHLAHASRVLGWDVLVCDVHTAALERMKNDIYPKRYGSWDTAIQLATNDRARSGGFDLIIIGTPPEFHLPLSVQSLEEKPKALLIEKPLCTPSLEGAQEFWEKSRNSSCQIFIGYTNVVSRVTQKVEELFCARTIGELQNLDVEFREHWEGIFRAHPWLKGPQDSYLGSWKRGGGATSEHSHALNLWQHFAHLANKGRIQEVSAMLDYFTGPNLDYDQIAAMSVRTEKGLTGRIVQDTISRPPRLRAFFYGTEGTLEWVNGYNAQSDAVLVRKPGQPEAVHEIPKARADDFLEELRHIERRISSRELSGLRLERGLDSMLVIAAAHRSEQMQSKIRINYAAGYRADSLEPVEGPAAGMRVK